MYALVRKQDSPVKGGYLKGDVVMVVEDLLQLSPKEAGEYKKIDITGNPDANRLLENKIGYKSKQGFTRAMRLRELPPMVARRKFYFDDNNNLQRRIT